MPNNEYLEAPISQIDFETDEKSQALLRVAASIDSALKAGVSPSEIQKVVDDARRYNNTAHGSVEYTDV